MKNSAICSQDILLRRIPISPKLSEPRPDSANCDHLLLMERELVERERALADRESRFEKTKELLLQVKLKLAFSVFSIMDDSFKRSDGKSGFNFNKVKYDNETMQCIWEKSLDKREQELLVKESTLREEEALMRNKVRVLYNELEAAKKLAIAEYTEFGNKSETTRNERAELVEEINSTYDELIAALEEESTHTPLSEPGPDSANCDQVDQTKELVLQGSKSDFKKAKYDNETMQCIWEKSLDKDEEELMVKESTLRAEEALEGKVRVAQNELEAAMKLAIAEYTEFRNKSRTTRKERAKLVEEINSAYDELIAALEEESTHTPVRR